MITSLCLVIFGDLPSRVGVPWWGVVLSLIADLTLAYITWKTPPHKGN